MTANLEDLLSRVASGDEAAFAALYGQTAGAVYGLAWTLSGEADWSQEMTAQALAQVWHAAPGYDPAQGSAQSWVISIARRHIVRQVRAVRSAPAPRDPAAAGPCARQEHQAVLLALHRGYTQDEISRYLGLAPETVAGLIRTALLKEAGPLHV